VLSLQENMNEILESLVACRDINVDKL